MSKTLTEQQVLDSLGVPDFRHVTKDKIMAFATMLPNMDKEVAIKAIEQFPAFSQSVTSLVTSLRDVMNSSINSNDESMRSVIATDNKIIDSLLKMLEKDNLSPEERMTIINATLELSDRIHAKDTENKKWLGNVIGTAAKVVGGGFLALCAFFGIKGYIDGKDK